VLRTFKIKRLTQCRQTFAGGKGNQFPSARVFSIPLETGLKGLYRSEGALLAGR
jgi:hypothetical protein